LDGRCRGSKRDGTRCTLPAKAPNGLCWAHDPANAQKRQRMASRAGKGKTSKLSKNLHELLEDLTQRVIDGELETSRGAVANQLISTRIRLLELERRRRETEELAAQIEELERVVAQRARSRRGEYGA
jgi:hypothetical protein